MTKKQRERSKAACEAAKAWDSVYAPFYAHARTALPNALDALDEAEEEIAGLEQAIETRDRMLADFAAKLKLVEAERDAAVRDIERMLAYEDGDNGWVCGYCKPERNCMTDEKCMPKWRGAQAAMGAEERSGEDE